MSESSLPRLPIVLAPLARYLLQRDGGAPTGIPQPTTITTTNPGGGSVDVDVIEWSYIQPDPLIGGRLADAFVVWWQHAETEDPAQSSSILPIESRSWVNVVPHGTTRSYALAVLRSGHRGWVMSDKATLPAWCGVT